MNPPRHFPGARRHIRRGEVWTVALGPVIANEQDGVRPCIVVSNEQFNIMPIAQAIIVPLTSRERGLPHHVPVDQGGGLTRLSWAMCEAVRAVSVQRLGRVIGVASDDTVRCVTDQVMLWLPAA